MKTRRKHSVCWQCLQLPAKPGELCRMCLSDHRPYSKGPRVKPLEEWTLKELEDTQELGRVPGDWKWHPDNEDCEEFATDPHEFQ